MKKGQKLLVVWFVYLSECDVVAPLPYLGLEALNLGSSPLLSKAHRHRRTTNLPKAPAPSPKANILQQPYRSLGRPTQGLTRCFGRQPCFGKTDPSNSLSPDPTNARHSRPRPASNFLEVSLNRSSQHGHVQFDFTMVWFQTYGSPEAVSAITTSMGLGQPTLAAWRPQKDPFWTLDPVPLCSLDSKNPT